MDILTLVPLSVHVSRLQSSREAEGLLAGRGVAVHQDLGLLVLSCSNKLQVFVLPEHIARGDVGSSRELTHVRTLGGGVAPMDFHFYDSGYMAFTDGSLLDSTLLLVTDTGKFGHAGNSNRDAVHVIDVVRGTHVGYLAAPGTIFYPRGVAARKSLAAVGCWDSGHAGNAVRVFEGSGATWTVVRLIVGVLSLPSGLRFTADGLRLAVADYSYQRVRIFCAQNGCFLCDIPVAADECAIFPLDVEECGSEWVICHPRGLVAVADTDTDTHTHAGVARRTNFDIDFFCLSLALVPGLGPVVRHEKGVQFFATPDAVAMAAMSPCKVAWMVAVCRGLVALTMARRRSCVGRFDQET
jgi:hypothetical protein